MNKKENLHDREVVMKRSTALLIAAFCLAAGFLAGVFYSAEFSGGRKVRKMTVNQSSPQAGQAGEAGAPAATSAQAEVIAALEEKVAANPQDAEAWTKLGHGYFDKDDPANAIRAYKKSLELKPGDANVLTDMGVMFRRQGKPQEALGYFDQAAAIDPKHQQSRYNKGIVLMHDLQNLEAAIKAWEELVAINPDAKTQDGIPLKEIIAKFTSPSPPVK